MKHSGTIAKALIPFFVFLFFLPVAAKSAKPSFLTGKKVLVVMSYHATHPQHQAIKEGIDSVLEGAEIKYFYMDTKKNLAGGDAKAKEAFDLYRKFNPDIVIAAEDNAQSLFVVPYLKDKVDTPVVFTGVNDDAAKYGYPASNVTGMLEKKHFREGITFAKILVPKIKRMAVIYKDNPSNRLNVAQFQADTADHSITITDYIDVNTMEELKSAIASMGKKVDALFMMTLTGILDENGKALEGNEIQSFVATFSKIPTLGHSNWQIESGALCGVIKISREKGTGAAELAVKILGGTPVTDVPITQNRNGQRIINVTTAKRLGIALIPSVLRGSELVR